LGCRAAIVGPNGTGKTTLLEHLEPELRALGFRTKLIRLYDQKRRFPKDEMKRFFTDLRRQDFILLDGAEQMSPLQWQSFKFRSKKAGGLLITAHEKGMLPTLIECATSPELFEEMISELLNGDPADSQSSTGELFQKHRGNIRGALREMYDVYAVRASS
jgi:translation initiation factor RLI1